MDAMQKPAVEARPNRHPVRSLVTRVGVLCVLATAGASPAASAAPSSTDRDYDLTDALQLRAYGEYRPRYLHQEGHDFRDSGATNTASHRARLGVEVRLIPWLGLEIAVQDVRSFGTADVPSSEDAATALDLYQAAVVFAPGDHLEVRLGRMPIAFENHRLVGDLGFVHKTKTFDGLRLTYDRSMLRIDAFYAKILEDTAPPFNDIELFATNVHFAPTPWFELGVVVLADLEFILHQSGVRRRVLTAGVLVEGAGLGLSYSFEAYTQTGTIGDGARLTGARGLGDRIRSGLVAARASYEAPVFLRPQVTLHGDWVSGDDDLDDGVQGVFSSPYATGHAFFGATDFFLDLPRDTNGQGVVDVGFGLRFQPLRDLGLPSWGRDLSIEAVVSSFQSALEIEQTFGSEVSLHVQWTPDPLIVVEAMYAAFIRGPLFPGIDPFENFFFASARVYFDVMILD